MSLQPAVRVALAAVVALALAAILGIATSASHVAVRNMSAQLQDTSRHVTLPRVEVVGRREFAIGAPAGSLRSAAVASTGCEQPS